jgi:hypothetical protein
MSLRPIFSCQPSPSGLHNLIRPGRTATKEFVSSPAITIYSTALPFSHPLLPQQRSPLITSWMRVLLLPILLHVHKRAPAQASSPLLRCLYPSNTSGVDLVLRHPSRQTFTGFARGRVERNSHHVQNPNQNKLPPDRLFLARFWYVCHCSMQYCVPGEEWSIFHRLRDVLWCQSRGGAGGGSGTCSLPSHPSLSPYPSILYRRIMVQIFIFVVGGGEGGGLKREKRRKFRRKCKCRAPAHLQVENCTVKGEGGQETKREKKQTGNKKKF